MNVLGVELEYDFFDADQLEVYETANKKVVDRIKEPTQYDGKSTSEALKIQCRIVNEFFDEVFREGTSEKVFGGKNNIKDHMEAFAIVASEAGNAIGELDRISDKYSLNRTERRQAERNQQKQAQKQNFRNFQKNAAYQGKGGNRSH